MANINGGASSERLDRIEGMIKALVGAQIRHEEQNRTEHQQLLTAQVLMVEQQRLTEQKMAETSDKLNGLIAVVDDFFRRVKPS